MTRERAIVPSPASFQGIVSQSPRMREVFNFIECVSRNDANVLIEGESGVGKERVARAIHRLGPLRREPFYAINCATLSGTLLLSELFGHERGAFAGASQRCAGKLELAREGTLFLDEVSEIPLRYQALVLRVLEERHIERVGSRRPIAMGARVIAASNRCLRDAVSNGEFRQDLHSRLGAVRIRVPPLRERPEDIPFLALHFARGGAVGEKESRVQFTEGAMRALTRHAWPGNVRELRSVVEHLCVVSGRTIDFDSLPIEVVKAAGMRPRGAAAHRAQPSNDVRERERARLLDALHRCNFRKDEAARLLGMDRTTLWRKMRRLGH